MKLASLRQHVRRSDIGLVVLGSFIAVIAYPLRITVDGVLYLSSARSIGTNLAATHYWWIREPAYPLMLRATTILFGTSDLPLSVIHGALLVASVVMVHRMVEQSFGLWARRWSVALVVVAIFTPQYFGYSSMVLKQAPMVFLVALASVLIAAAARPTTVRSAVVVASITIVVAGLSPLMSITLNYFWLWPAFIIGVLLARGLDRARRPADESVGSWGRIRPYLLRYSLVGLLIAASGFALGAAGDSAWSKYRTANAAADQVEFGFEVDESGTISRILNDPWSLVEGIRNELPQLMMLSPTDNPGGVQENDRYTDIQSRPEALCGSVDDFTLEPYTSYGMYVQMSCRSARAQQVVREIHPLGRTYYQASMVALLLATPLLLLRRRFGLLLRLSPALWFAFLYAAKSDFTVDRYGLPLFPYASASVLLLSVALARLAARIWMRWRTADEESESVIEPSALVGVARD